MKTTSFTSLRFNPAKVRAVRGDRPLIEFADSIGFKPDFLSKVERGDRNFSLEKFVEFCRRTNRFPGDFFDMPADELQN